MKKIFQYISILWKKLLDLLKMTTLCDIQKSLQNIEDDVSNLNEIASKIDLLFRDYNSSINEGQKRLKLNEIADLKNKLKTEIFKAIGSLTNIGTQIQ